MMGHNIDFDGGTWLIIPKLSPLPLLIWSTALIMTALSVACINIPLANAFVLKS